MKSKHGYEFGQEIEVSDFENGINGKFTDRIFVKDASNGGVITVIDEDKHAFKSGSVFSVNLWKYHRQIQTKKVRRLTAPELFGMAVTQGNHIYIHDNNGFTTSTLTGWCHPSEVRAAAREGREIKWESMEVEV